MMLDFEGHAAGDPFCFLVDAKTFKRLMHRRANKTDKALFIDGFYRVPPDVVFPNAGKMRFRIECEEVESSQADIEPPRRLHG